MGKVKELYTEYTELLKSADWYFEYSDDQKVWQSGVNQFQQLEKMAQEIDPKYTIWNEYAPDAFKVTLD